MPLSRSGWLLVAASLAAAAVGRLFGILELTLLAIAGATLCLASAIAAAVAVPRLEVRRLLSSTRSSAGGSVLVTLRVANRGRRRSPVVELADRVGRRGARLLVAPLRPDEQASSVYTLPTPRRGRLTVGPLEVCTSDPFGVTSARRVATGSVDVVVFPRILPLRPLPRIPTDDPADTAGTTRRLTAGNGEFHALRPYDSGDDVRRVHWASSMRIGELMVRQNEQPWDAVATVVLDTRAGAHTTEGFEAAVTAAASIVAGSHRARSRFRLTTSSGWDSGLAAGRGHLDRILRHLATVDADGNEPLGGRLAAVARRSSGATAFVVGRLSTADQAALRRAGARVPAGVVVTSDPATRSPAPRLPLVRAGRSLVSEWELAVARLMHRSPAPV